MSNDDVTKIDQVTELPLHTAYTYLTYKVAEMKVEQIEHEQQRNKLRSKSNKSIKNQW